MTDIYTGRGDAGKTDLWAAEERVSKASARIEAYGTVDELIAFLGHAAARSDERVAEDLEQVQHRLHTVMAQLADVEHRGDKEVVEGHVAALEELVDGYSDEVDDLDGFVLPGGSDAGALLHVARSVCRRAERRIVALADDEPVDEQVLAYVNRLSDLLFVMARWQNRQDGEAEVRVEYGE